MKPSPWQVGLVLFFGMLSVATAAIFIRLCLQTAGVKGVGFSLFIAATRLILAAAILLPAWPKLLKTPVSPQAYYYGIGAGLCLALHFATWITSLSFTSVAVSTTLVTTNPVWVALLSWWWYQEKPTKLSMVGIAVALAGGILIALGDPQRDLTLSNNNAMVGNLLALVGAWMASLYLLLGKQAQAKGLSTTGYITLAYSVAALVLLPLPLIFNVSYLGYPNLVYVYILLMAIFAQIIGHGSINWSIRWISPTKVTLAILFEPVGAGLLAFFVFNEVPPLTVLAGVLVLLIGVAIAVLGSSQLIGDQK